MICSGLSSSTRNIVTWSPLIKTYREYKNILNNIESAKELLTTEKDEEMREMARMELDELQELTELEEKIRVLLLPADPEDEKNAIVEIRAGTGGR
jgi:peptide chain release factor 1